jgi:uncharacterized protein YkwD
MVAACVAVGPTASNSAKLGEAAAFAGMAAAATAAQTVLAERARNNAPMHGARSDCDNDHGYACVSLSAPQGDPRPPEREMTIEEAQDYVLGYVNGVRKLNDIPPVHRDPDADTVAAASAESLSTDHRPGLHALEHELSGAEVQGPAEGTNDGFLQDQLGAVMGAWMKEGHGGAHHDLLLLPRWRKLGVGIAQRSGRTYFTVELQR